MVDKKERRSSNVDPQDIAPSYTESTYSSNSISSEKLVADNSSALDLPTFHPGVLGARTTPGEGGFAYADTPQATVFVQKREWIEGEWNYTSLNATERKGKNQELLTRIALGNLITRKLDQLNDHEVMTKFSGVNSSISNVLNKSLSEIASSQTISSKTLSNILTSAGSPVTKYYTETVYIIDPSSNIDYEKKAETIVTTEYEKIPIEETLNIQIATEVKIATQEQGQRGRLRIRAKPNFNAQVLGGVLKDSIVTTTGAEEETGIVWNVVGVNPKVVNHPAKFPTLEHPGASNQGLWWKIDLLKLTEDKILLIPGDQTKTLKELQSYKYGYISKAPQGVVNNYLSEPSTTIPYPGGPVKVITGYENTPITSSQQATSLGLNTSDTASAYGLQNTFNGVIELCNIQSVSVSLSNSGRAGSATFSLQNPMNLLTIGEDDIEIALNTIQLDKEDLSLNSGTLYNVDGKYNTEHAKSLMTRQEMAAAGNQTSGIIKFKDEHSEIANHIANLQYYKNTGDFSSEVSLIPISESLNITYSAKTEGSTFVPPVNTTIAHIQSSSALGENISSSSAQIEINPLTKVKLNNKLDELRSRQKVLERLIDSFDSSKFLSDDYNSNNAELQLRRNQLKKYYQNKTILSVYDRVFIWMSSPSRSSFKLEEGTVVSEASNRSGLEQKFLQKIQEIVNLIKQIDVALQKAANTLNVTISNIFTNQTLTLINQELFTNLKSNTYTSIAKKLKDSNWLQANLGGLLTAGDLSSLNLKLILNAIDSKLKEFDSFVKAAGITKVNSIDDLSVFDLKNKSSTSRSNAIQGSDPRFLFLENENYAGLDEDQIQVFQGVITSISRSYGDGIFTIQVECQDNTDFLERSRYTSIPGLKTNFRELRTELDDPIYRETRNKKTIENSKEAYKLNDVAGRWKTGILTVNAAFNPGSDDREQEKGEASGKTSSGFTYSSLDLKNGAKPFKFPFDQPFKGADPANIISVLVTGVPFDPEVYTLNSLYTGSLNATPTDEKGRKKDGEIVLQGPFEDVRDRILGQVRKYGDFEPFLELSRKDPTKEELQSINYNSIFNLAVSITNFAKIYIANRKQYFADLDKRINNAITKQKKNKTSGDEDIYVLLTAKNLNVVLDDQAPFPTTTSEIQLKQNSLGDPRLEFLVQCAINQVGAYDLSAHLNNLTTQKNDKEVQKFKSFVSDVSSSTINKFYGAGQTFVLTRSEVEAYQSIESLAKARVKNGIAFKILYSRDDAATGLMNYFVNNKNKNSPINNVNLDFTDLQKVAKIRGVQLDDKGKLVSGSPLQATKASIIFKQKPNYLVISDQYYKSPNLVDYVETIISSPGEALLDKYRTVKERCEESARALDWEFYADSQGHIRFRQPTYNRTLLRHLLDLSKIDFFSKTSFAKLFDENNLNSTYKLATLRSFQTFISKQISDLKNFINNKLSDASLTPVHIEVVSKAYSLSDFQGRISFPTNFLDVLPAAGLDIKRIKQVQNFAKLNINTSFPIQTKAKLPNGADPTKQSIDSILELMNSIDFKKLASTNLNSLNSPEFSSTGSQILYWITTTQYSLNTIISIQFDLYSKDLALITSPSYIDQFKDDVKKFTDDLEVLISTLKYLILFKQRISEKLSNFEGELTSNFEDLTDQRYIHVIPSAIILRETYNETSPDFTRLNVYATQPLIGTFSETFISQTTQWAGSVDYDLWRVYGYKESERMSVPFLRTNRQAVLYAHQLMAREYGKILTGQISVRGDSKYQLGDTVYIEDEDLYFYITDISHNFTYGSSYETTLTLRYGRRPGQFIPHPFDVLGKTMIDSINSIYQLDPTDISAILDEFEIAQKARQEQIEQENKK